MHKSDIGNYMMISVNTRLSVIGLNVSWILKMLVILIIQSVLSPCPSVFSSALIHVLVIGTDVL